MLRVKGNYKRNQDRKLLQGIISEETKKCNKKLRRQKAGEQVMHSARRKSIPAVVHFLLFYAILSSGL